jgi:putative sterol carrier protein
VVAFLSTAWVEALDRAARARTDQTDPTDPTDQTVDAHLVVEQRIEGDGTHPPVVFHLTLDHGAVAVAPGPAPDPTVTFTQSRATARAIAAGETSAQRAFMTGGLRVGGDLQVLLAAQERIGALGDVFAAVRADTDFGPATPGDEPH